MNEDMHGDRARIRRDAVDRSVKRLVYWHMDLVLNTDVRMTRVLKESGGTLEKKKVREEEALPTNFSKTKSFGEQGEEIEVRDLDGEVGRDERRRLDRRLCDSTMNVGRERNFLTDKMDGWHAPRYCCTSTFPAIRKAAIGKV